MGVRRLLISLALSIPALGAAQGPPVSQVEVGKLGARYGEAQVAPLDEIVRSPDQFQGQMVRTQGLFEPGLDARQFVLSEGHDRVLLLPVVAGSEVQMLLGRRVEVRGVVRKIRPKQYVMGQDLDKIEDPELPVMPAPGPQVPRVTLSYFSIFDATAPEHGQGGAGGGVLQGLLRDNHAKKRSVRVVGQFRGANLFGDLPDLPGREPDDFVLKEGDAAIWVIGKAAKGKGFHLDPRLKGDTRFWLEVEGRLEPCAGNQVCLKARHVQMAKRPAPPAED
jgi:hypothetical protein